VHKLLTIILLALAVVFSTANVTLASSRTLETRFALSADARSEFSKQFSVMSAGRIIVEASWSSATAGRAPSSLKMILVQPDGSVVSSQTGISILKLEHRTTAQDLERLGERNNQKWTVKILNDADSNRTDVAGTLRITVPTASRALEDTQFTLLGSGNAQEIPFTVPAPGRVQVDVSWEPDLLSKPSEQVALVVSFIHPGEAKTYARRQGSSPINVEHQVSEQALDRGSRWIVRVQNDSQTKVSGRVRIIYTPSL
jgi:hypothetical protein